MDRFFLARKIAGKVLVDIPTPEETEKLCLEKKPESSGKLLADQLEAKAGKCAQIVESLNPHFNKIAVIKAASELMFESDEVIEKMYNKVAHL